MNLRRQSVHLMAMEKEQVLVLENISIAYGTRFSKEKKRVLGPVSLCIRKGEAVGITGENGAGKSTLLKILAGVRTATRGQVSAPKDTVIAFLPQHLMTEDGRTVFEEASQAFAHLHEMEAHIETLNKQLA